MKTVVANFNQEKARAGAFSLIVQLQTSQRLYETLLLTCEWGARCSRRRCCTIRLPGPSARSRCWCRPPRPAAAWSGSTGSRTPSDLTIWATSCREDSPPDQNRDFKCVHYEAINKKYFGLKYFWVQMANICRGYNVHFLNLFKSFVVHQKTFDNLLCLSMLSKYFLC